MNVVRVCTRLDADLLHLPELQLLLGRNVEIVVREQPADASTGDWQAAAHAAQALRQTGYDFEAWREQREFDQQHASRQLL